MPPPAGAVRHRASRPLRRLSRALLIAGALAACTADESCVDDFGEPCVNNSDCAPPDGCREIVGRGSFCAPPDGKGLRIVNSSITPVSLAEGRTDEKQTVLRGGRFRGLVRAEGKTTPEVGPPTVLVEGDIR